MFPNSPNTHLTLLNITSIVDTIGSKINVIKTKKEVIGILRSVTKTEYLGNIQINLEIEFKVLIQSFLYDGSKFALVNNKLYKIERTYLYGGFIELYLSSSDIEVKNND